MTILLASSTHNQGKRALGPWGESIIMQFVREAVDEAQKLEAALARLRTPDDAAYGCWHEPASRRTR